MRIFILCTGRSGSSTIIKACDHIDNYTSNHESLANAFGGKRFDYPDNHIEADNRLSWHLGSLHKKFGDEAFYVHLKRDRDKVAQSFTKRFFIPRSIMDSFCEGIRMTPSEVLSKETRLQACYDYIDTVQANIEHFLIDKSNVMVLNLEHIQDEFPVFWEKIGAKGSLESALKEFTVTHNSSKKRNLNYLYRLKLLVMREWKHLIMSLRST